MKIIVVDDEPIIADTLVDILKGEGHDAFAVSSGAAAIKWAEMLHPGAIVTDVVMPGINGIDMAKEIMKLLPECRIILFSGQAATLDLLERARAEGYNFEVLAKPINPDILLSALVRPRHAGAESPPRKTTLREAARRPQEKHLKGRDL